MTVAQPYRVPSAPLREEVERRVASGVTYTQIAAWAGWTKSNGTGDISYLKRLLGMRAWPPSVKNGKRYECHRTETYMSREAALKLCRALNLDPVDVGL